MDEIDLNMACWQAECSNFDFICLPDFHQTSFSALVPGLFAASERWLCLGLALWFGAIHCSYFQANFVRVSTH